MARITLKGNQVNTVGELPKIGEKAPDFPLWQLEDGAETSLSAVWSSHMYTVVEFGSFT